MFHLSSNIWITEVKSLRSDEDKLEQAAGFDFRLQHYTTTTESNNRFAAAKFLTIK